MRTIPGLLGVLLALALVAGSASLSAHLATHNPAASDLCSLCVHAAGSNSAIAPGSAIPLAAPAVRAPDQPHPEAPVLPPTPPDHPCRAPPSAA